MNRLKSRKFWAWVVTTLLTVIVIFKSSDNIAIVYPVYGIITGAYMGVQGVIDAIAGGFLKKVTRVGEISKTFTIGKESQMIQGGD